MPKAGGNYFIIERSLGPIWGIIGGISSWLSLSLKASFALLGMGIFFTLVFPHMTEMQIKLIAVAFCVFFMFLNIIGVKQSGRFQVGLVLALLAIMVFYVFRGSSFIEPQNYTLFMPYGFSGVLATAGFVLVSFGGITKIASVAEEVKNPGRNIPLAMFLALGACIGLYAGVAFVTVGVVDAGELAHSLIPISLGASAFMGQAGVIIMALAALLAFISTGNAGILTASRDVMAMSRDYLFPPFFQKISARFKTPYRTIIFITIFMVVAILWLDLEGLVKIASTQLMLMNIFILLSLIAMRKSRIPSYRPKFTSPAYPWSHILTISVYAYLITQMGTIPITIAGIIAGAAVAWHFIYVRGKVTRHPALGHVIEDMSEKKRATPTLPEELKEIVMERDEITVDRVHRLIEECEIIDYDPPPILEHQFEDVMGKACDILSWRLQINRKMLFERLLKPGSSYFITPGTAISRGIIEEVSKPGIVAIRCKKGIVFPNIPQPIRALFVLVAPPGERSLYLLAMAAVTQIARDKDYNKKWLEARDANELKIILLLAERKRFGVDSGNL